MKMYILKGSFKRKFLYKITTERSLPKQMYPAFELGYTESIRIVK